MLQVRNSGIIRSIAKQNTINNEYRNDSKSQYTSKESHLGLLDNYNRALMKIPAFKGIESAENLTNEEKLNQIKPTNLSKRISSLVKLVKKPSIVLVGNDEKKDMEALKKKLGNYSLDFIMDNIYYINDPDAKIPLAIMKKDKYSYLYNLDDKKTFFLNKERETLLDNPTISYEPIYAISRDNDSLLINIDIDDKELENPEFKVINVSTSDNIREINRKNIEKLYLSETDENKEAIQNSTTVNTKITFDDIGGLDDTIERIKQEILYPIKAPFAYAKRKKIDHGTVLYGVAGTGKSLIGEALANEAGANFIKINASELENCLVGSTEENWRDLFDKAIKNQPCIIFIDEFDAVAKRRGGHDVYGDKALNTILSLMSNVEKNNSQVYVIAATNQFESLDPAAVRSGRFGNHIEVPKPDLEGCYQIFNIHSKIMKIEEEFDNKFFAINLYKRGATGADIAGVIDKAWDKAYERLGIFDKIDDNTLKQEDIDKVTISKDDLYEALDMVLPPKDKGI